METLRRGIARAVLFVCLGTWLFSLFLPAFDTFYWSETHHVSGFGAIGHSMLLGLGALAMVAMSSAKDGGHLLAALLYLLMGTIWVANVVMAAAPFSLARMERGRTKGGVVAGLLLVFFCEAIGVFLLGRRSGDPRFFLGSYLWAAAVGCTGVLFLVMRVTRGMATKMSHLTRASVDR